MQLRSWHPLAACRWTTPLLGWRLAIRRLVARPTRPLSTAWPSMAASRAPTRMPGLPQVGPQQLQAPKWSRAALTAALVRALLLRAARGRWLAARAAAAHAPQRRRAAPARRGPQLLPAELDLLCLLTHRIPLRWQRAALVRAPPWRLTQAVARGPLLRAGGRHRGAVEGGAVAPRTTKESLRMCPTPRRRTTERRPPLPSLVALEAPQRRSPLGGLVPRIFAA